MDANLDQAGYFLQVAVAFGGGVASFLSPCVLPLLPGYLSMMSGYSTGQIAEGDVSTARMVRVVGLFVLGFTLVFIGLGAGATAVSQLLVRNLPVLTRVAGGVIVVAGMLIVALTLSDRGPLRPLSRERRFQVRPSRLGRWAAPVMGMAFGFGWTPCIGPILTVVLVTAADQATLGRGIGLLIAFSVGLGIPFLLAAVGLVRLWVRAQRWHRPVTVASGTGLAAFGVVMLTGNLNILAGWFTDLFYSVPWLTDLATV